MQSSHCESIVIRSVTLRRRLAWTDLAHVNRKTDLNEGFSMMRERTFDDPKVIEGVRFSGINK